MAMVDRCNTVAPCKHTRARGLYLRSHRTTRNNHGLHFIATKCLVEMDIVLQTAMNDNSVSAALCDCARIARAADECLDKMVPDIAAGANAISLEKIRRRSLLLLGPVKGRCLAMAVSCLEEKDDKNSGIGSLRRRRPSRAQ
jgi:hypothetical protein